MEYFFCFSFELKTEDYFVLSSPYFQLSKEFIRRQDKVKMNLCKNGKFLFKSFFFAGVATNLVHQGSFFISNLQSKFLRRSKKIRITKPLFLY